MISRKSGRLLQPVPAAFLVGIEGMHGQMGQVREMLWLEEADLAGLWVSLREAEAEGLLGCKKIKE